MTKTEREMFHILLYKAFLECCTEDADTIGIKMELPDIKMQLTAKINFDVEDMGVK